MQLLSVHLNVLIKLSELYQYIQILHTSRKLNFPPFVGGTLTGIKALNDISALYLSNSTICLSKPTQEGIFSYNLEASLFEKIVRIMSVQTQMRELLILLWRMQDLILI